MDWISIEENTPELGTRVLTYSPHYNGDINMTYRLIDTQFLRFCSDVTHWCYLEAPQQ